MHWALFLIWSILGSRYYVCTIKQACDSSKTVDTDYGPLAFNWSDDQPVLGKDWAAFRDSIAGLIADGKSLRIGGMYYDSEAGGDTSSTLGQTRAANIKALFANLIPDSLMVAVPGLFSDSSDKLEYPFPAFSFDVVEAPDDGSDDGSDDGTDIVELENSILIYFPFSSSDMLEDTKVDRYLENVAKKLNSTGGKVKLTGHTDYIGSHNVNWKLSERRAKKVRDILRKHGVPGNQIIVEGKGEIEPIASNETEAGRAKNRRVELELL